MATASPVYPRFSFGKTISDTFGAIAGNFRQLVVLSLLLSALPGALLSVLYFGPMMGLGYGAAPLTPGLAAGVFSTALVGGLISWVLFCLLEIAVIRATLLHFRGEKAAFGETLAFALRKLPPVLGASLLGWLVIILVAVAIGTGFVLIIGNSIAQDNGIAAIVSILFLLPLAMVPVFFLMIAWIVQVPAIVAEPIGVLETFGRSWRLTQGSRWRILALCLLYIASLWILFSALSVAFLPMAGMQAMAGGDFGGSAALIPLAILQALSGMVASIVGLPGLAAIYANLREAKEGVNRDRIADVFG